MTPRLLLGPGRMILPAVLLWGATLSSCAAAAGREAGFLLDSVDHAVSKVTPYMPKPGDLVLYDDHDRLHRLVYTLAGTGPPVHVALVIRREDGTPALLELTGPTIIGAKVQIMDVPSRLQSYPGEILVRRLHAPLSAEQEQSLLQFARGQEGKNFSWQRILLQATPFRPRCGLRYQCFARTYLNRRRWICSEMVVAALCSAQLLDPAKCPANAVYPRDLAFDERYDLSRNYDAPLTWTPAALEPPRSISGPEATLLAGAPSSAKKPGH